MSLRRFERRFRRIVVESLFGELLAVSGSIAAGVGLASMLNELASLPSFLVLVPAFMNARGAVSGASGSRMTVALHTGEIEPRFSFTEELRTEVFTSTVLGVLLAFVIGVVSHLFAVTLGFESAGLATLVSLSTLAGVIASLIMIPAVDLATIFFYRVGLDPNNVVGPYTAMFGDMVSILSLFVSAQVILVVLA